MANMTPVNALETTITVAYKEGTATEFAIASITNFPTAGVAYIDDSEEWVIKVWGTTDVGNKKLQTLSNAVAVYKSAGASGHTFAVGTEIRLAVTADYVRQYPIGPASSTDHALVRWDGVTGRLLINSGIIINDTDDISGVHGLTATNNLDIGTHNFRARNLTADALAAGRVVFTGANGLLSASAALLFVGGALSLTGDLFSTGSDVKWMSGEDADSETKRLKIVCREYLSDSEPEGFIAVAGRAVSGVNRAIIGGGTTGENMATEIRLVTTPVTGTRGSTTGNTRLFIDGRGNVAVGTATVDATAEGCFAIANGVEPSAHTDNLTYLYSKDSTQSAGATLGIYAESPVVAHDAGGAWTISHKWFVWINGAEYAISLDAV